MAQVHPDDLDPVEVPGASRCPYCDGEPTEQSQAKHSLSVLDYLHDDVALRCSECRRKWTCGVPIGGPPPEEFADLWCNSCDGGFKLVHRVEVASFDVDEKTGDTTGVVKLHLKCPHHERFKCPACDQLMEPAFGQNGKPFCPRCTVQLSRDDLDGHGCFHFDVTERTLGRHGIASTFYPQVTGDTERGVPYGDPEP